MARSTSAPKPPVQTRNLTIREGSIKWDIVKSAEQFSQVVWERPTGYRNPKWELVRATCDVFGTEQHDGLAILEGGYAIAQLVDTVEYGPLALCYSLFLNRHIQARPEDLLWLERRETPEIAHLSVSFSAENQASGTIQKIIDRLEEVTAQVATKASDDLKQMTVRTRWTDHDGLITYDELLGHEGRITYAVYDGHGRRAEESSVSEAERSYWIEVALEDTCEVCEVAAVQIVCAPDIMGPHYAGFCRGCYLTRPFNDRSDAGQLPIIHGDPGAECSENATGFGTCWRVSEAGLHLHTLDRSGETIVFAVRASGEQCEIVGRIMTMEEYLDALFGPEAE
jgi:hypothetical protein